MGNYWLSQGKVTKQELNKAFTYNRKHSKPTDFVSLRHQVARTRKRYQLNRYLKGKEESGTDPTNPWQIAYGSCQTGGTLTFIHASSDNQFLHLIVTLAAHEIQMVRKVYFNSYEVAWNTDLTTKPTGLVTAAGIFDGLVRLQINYGTDSQGALSVPVGDLSDGANSVGNKWTTNYRQRGHAHVYLRLKWSEAVFKSGLPEFSFLLDGKADVNDPTVPALRPGSQNPALLLNDYLTNTRWGLSIPQSKVNGTRLAAAVAACDQAIALAAGGSETRYQASGIFGADAAPGQVVEDLLASMAGRLVYSEGAWSIYAGLGQTSVLTLDEHDILSEVSLITKTPRQDSFNRVRSTYVNKLDGFQETDAPVVKNSTYVTEDSGEIVYEDLTFPLTVSPVAVQRLGKIALERSRQGIVIEFTAKLRAYQVEAGDWVNVTFARYGWTAKTFEVVRSALVIEEVDSGVPGFAVRMTLQETAAGIYDWNTGNETQVDLSPNTNLPNPFVAVVPTGLTLASGTAHLYLRNDGTVFSRLFVSWTVPVDSFVTNGGYTEIQYKKSADSNWQDYGDVPGSSSSAYILDVDDGLSYDVRIRSVNAMGVRSAWVTATGHTVLGKSAAPSDVTGFAAAVQDFGIRMVWTQVTDLDLRDYEIRIGTTVQTWATAPLSFRVRGDRYYYEFRTAGTYRVRIKAIDTSGNFSTNDAFADVVVALPSTPTLAATFEGESVVLSWTASTGAFAIKEYELRYGASYAAGTPVATVTALRFRLKATWLGNRTFWLVARDVAGNQGNEASVTATINPPNPVVALKGWQVDNNALIDWDVPSPSTLPVERYSIYRGGSLLGFVDGTFATYIELVSSLVTFRVHAVDTAGNEGNPQYVAIQVASPPDFVLHASQVLYPSSVVSSVNMWVGTLLGSSYNLPVNSSETFTQHYTNNSKTEVQGFIDAGFTRWLQPSSAEYGEVVWEADLGLLVQEATISIVDLFGSGGTQPCDHELFISHRASPSDAWSTPAYFSGSPTVATYQAKNFRYVRARLSVTAQFNGATAFYLPPRLVVGTKKATDGGIQFVNASDAAAGGTLVTFGRPFLDVIKVTGTGMDTAIFNGLSVIINFIDAPNPTTFRILLYDKNGTPVSGNVAWDAEGLVSVTQ